MVGEGVPRIGFELNLIDFNWVARPTPDSQTIKRYNTDIQLFSMSYDVLDNKLVNIHRLHRGHVYWAKVREVPITVNILQHFGSFDISTAGSGSMVSTHVFVELHMEQLVYRSGGTGVTHNPLDIILGFEEM